MPTTYTIPNGAQYMAATLYTGTGAGNLVINNATAGSNGFYPDLIWAKSRNAAYYNNLLDYPRGTSVRLFSNLSDAESNNGCQSSFNSNGFTLNADAGGINNSGTTYVAWQWNAGSGTTSTNTSGSITSTVDVNATAGFSIVKYTGTGSAATIGHGLGVAPQFIAIKIRNNTYSWRNYHVSTGNTGYVYFNSTDAYTASSTTFNNTSPTSSVFSVGTEVNTNANGGTFVAYCWAPVAGYSAFGSYTGNGSADGPFIYTGFRPRYVLIKRTNTTEDWVVDDSSRSPYNVTTEYLLPSSSAAAGNVTLYDFLSNGFKMRGISQNNSGSTFIYAAFAENPFKYANAR